MRSLTGGEGCSSLEMLEARRLLSADAVLQWNATMLNVVRADRTPPPLAARNMAMVQIAVADTVNAIQPTNNGYLYHARGPKDASLDAAVATAAHDVLVAVFPARRAA